MSDNEKPLPQVTESRVVAKKRARFSFVWVIPILAAVIGVWVAVTRILSQGPEITITFTSGDGLEAGKTKVKFNGIEVGTIKTVRIASDHKHVIATVQMDPKSKDFLVKDTKFWVVRPQISGLNISGLGTLISGDYIGVELGQSRESERNFTALEKVPIVAGDAPGRFLLLKASALGSLDQGSPVYFRRLPAGQVVSYELDKDGQSLNVKVFVQAPYDQYVTPNTRFWQASGIDMSLSASGLSVHTESLMSILAGGIAFETPEASPLLPPTEADAPYTLFRNRAEAFRSPPRQPHNYLLIFKQSVRGLVPGAPVELDGITIGEVTEVRAQFDKQTQDFSVPVTIEVDPVRFGVKLMDSPAGVDNITDHRQAMDAMIARGLRAQLRTGSLISGALYVAVDMFPEAPKVALDWSQKPVQLPTQPGQVEAIETSLANLMKKLEQMQFKEISDDLRKTIGDLDTTLVSAHGTLTNTDKLLGNADKLLSNANTLIAPNSVFVQGLDGTLQDVGGAARSLRVLADYLERHPEALIRGKTGDAKQ